ncbi:MAG: CoA transferase [Pseudomonadales bacterium]|jgi:crotonobetainyl-CoA:carnitine CoA-transferase CaiB-like acyl-CoA transferase|nr:CoA transferase [Pseudomonadales bacterium]MDP6473198.1 CoA transferase [Pseudomonadales bacterium]MDP6826042.1 CoA transferase [Pseudomonadales bacterium]MDP6973241.1 CoA transferase [Pseudomonadales bacterium]|tara:strand:- start:425 stop:1645 length:1221 start_codon:yes stop_codon:yes gene_type:complete
MTQALDGIRVLSICNTVASAYCAKLFASHGAHVIDIEPASVGAVTRQLPPFRDGRDDAEASLLHSYLSTNKSSVALDLATPLAREAAAGLAANCQIVIDASAPGCCPLSDETLKKSNPELIVLRITWFGLEGPLASQSGSDAVIQAATGMVAPIGSPDQPPCLPSGYQAQIIGGLTAYNAVLGQVIARELGNASGSTIVDVSILEANMCFTDVGAVVGFMDVPRGSRMGVNRFPPTYPLSVYPCRDGWLGVTALTPGQWKSFCALLDLDHLADIPAYQTALGRLADAQTLEPIIQQAVAKRSADQLFHTGQAARIPLAPVPTMEELFHTDQYVERNSFELVEHSDQGTFMAPVTPFRLHRTPAQSAGRLHALGEDTRRELRSCGMSEETIARLTTIQGAHAPGAAT